ncbi:hypothetical protein [Streptomyces sp. Wb2n-11]|uniref:hypothetical protein n=1 Tax=Streptomyces sp. Wb2n-11 TaxID=1030533 RepID=UPI000B81DCB5|nr:hypothetical protein [Streptomyces sp. Wb2n-11]
MTAVPAAAQERLFSWTEVQGAEGLVIKGREAAPPAGRQRLVCWLHRLVDQVGTVEPSPHRPPCRRTEEALVR